MNSDGNLVICYNGCVYTADKNDAMAEALAFKDGFVLSAGTSAELFSRYGKNGLLVDLEGSTVIPGLVDAHLHPLWGGISRLAYSLNYEDLSSAEIVRRTGELLKADKFGPESPEWLAVTSWRRNPEDDPKRSDLDALTAKRKVFLFSDDCHFALLNSPALSELGFSGGAPQPPDGWIRRGPAGELNGIIEAGPAMRAFDRVISLRGRDYLLAALKTAFSALSAQGVTAVLDARCSKSTLELVKSIQAAGELPLRFSGALEILSAGYGPGELKTLAGDCEAQRERFDGGSFRSDPDIAVRRVKFFLDGMPSARTAYLQEPYFENCGAGGAPLGKSGGWRGKPYLQPGVLKDLVLELSRRDFSPHFHAIADGALALALDAVRLIRRELPGKDIRPALAHLDLASPLQYQQMKELDAFAVLSFQWAGQTAESISEQLRLYGAERFQGLETHGKFFDAGVKTACGSDWPVEPLDEWGNFQIGMTRRLFGENSPRLGNDRDLTLTEVLRAATVNAAASLGQERHIGSLEPGKAADLAVLKGRLFGFDKSEIRKTEVLETVLGGKTVWKKASGADGALGSHSGRL